MASGSRKSHPGVDALDPLAERLKNGAPALETPEEDTGPSASIQREARDPEADETPVSGEAPGPVLDAEGEGVGTPSPDGGMPEQIAVFTSPHVVVRLNLNLDGLKVLPTPAYIADWVRRCRELIDAEDATAPAAPTDEVERVPLDGVPA